MPLGRLAPSNETRRGSVSTRRSRCWLSDRVEHSMGGLGPVPLGNASGEEVGRRRTVPMAARGILHLSTRPHGGHSSGSVRRGSTLPVGAPSTLVAAWLNAPEAVYPGDDGAGHQRRPDVRWGAVRRPRNVRVSARRRRRARRDGRLVRRPPTGSDRGTALTRDPASSDRDTQPIPS